MKAPIEAFNATMVSIVTTCMNRNEFLCQSLPTWLGIGFARIIVVDWNSSTPVSQYLDEHIGGLDEHEITVIRSDQHEPKKYFNDGWARNTGARLSDTEYILFIDSDMKIRDKEILLNEVPQNPDICYRGNIPGGYGTCLVSRNKFNQVNGYSERMWSWGGEDLDLYIRLKMQQGCEIETFFPDELFEHIHHGDDLRVNHRLQQWEDLKEGANIQRLKGEPWTASDTQRKVFVSLHDKKAGTVCEYIL
jgi:glycosyltransferase involved in cell wall biosynthesis